MDLCRSISDGDHQAPPQEPSGIPFLVISNVSNGTLDFSGTRFVGEDYFKSLMPSRIPSNGDILVTVTGSYGIVVRVVTNRPFCFQRHIALLKCYTAESGYLFYALQSNNVKRYFDAVATGTAQKTVALNHLRATPIPFPPFSEQKRIVARIEELFKIADTLGAATDGLAAAAKRLDKKILDLAIRGKLVPQDPNDEPASELLKRIAAASHKSPCQKLRERDSSLAVTWSLVPEDAPFAVPKSWAWVRLRDLGVFCGGHTPSMRNPDFWSGDILWVSSKDMKSKYITDTQMKITCLGAEKLNVLNPGALLMCTRSGILRRTFPIAIAKRRLTINQDLRALTLWLPGIVEYVYLVLASFEQTILMNYKKAGTTVESIIWDKFIDLPIPLPPLAEQNRIVAKVEEIKALSKMCAIH